MKITVVGGASTYTPELIDGIARLRDTIAVDELVLVDPARDRLEVVAEMARRMLVAAGHPARVVTETESSAGVADADFVLLQLRVGGQAARIQDETWPLQCGCIGQETTGAGGLAKALRTVPVVLDIAEQVRRRAAPGAWIVNFTNPVGIVTRALLQSEHRAVGLCNVAIGFERFFAGLLGVDPDAVAVDHIGLNHLTWERRVVVDDVDRLPQLIEQRAAEIAEHVHLSESLIRRLGVVPSYYLLYFYAHDESVREQAGQPTRGEQVADIERTLLQIYADTSVDTKPELLGSRGGAYYSEAAIRLLASLSGDRGDVQVVNVRNDGCLSCLPDDAVIEVPAVIGAKGAAAVDLEQPAPLFAGLIAHTFAYEQLALEAARLGGRDRVAAALLAHPLVGQFDLAEELTDLLMAANHDHLVWAR